MPKLFSKLTIHHLQQKIRIGVTAKEQAIKQRILITLTIEFHALPKACKNDALAETICYDTLINKINLFCQKSKCKLIEHFAFSLFQLIIKLIGSQNKIHLTVTKFPKIAGLESASFELEG